MQYAVLLYDDERKWQNLSPTEVGELMGRHNRFSERVAELGGSVVDGHPLQDTPTATSLRWNDDEITITEGPFAETAEQFGGYYVVDLPDLDAAIDAAKVLPHHAELRPVVVYEGEPPADLPAPASEDAGDLFAVLLYGDEEPWLRATPSEREEMYAKHGAFAAGVVARGAGVAGGQELAHSSTATTLRRVGDETVVSDGPFAETTEQLTGFYVLRAKDVDVVVDAVKELPGDTTEIRPIADMSQPVA
jgi:hypothetical protein